MEKIRHWINDHHICRQRRFTADLNNTGATYRMGYGDYHSTDEGDEHNGKSHSLD